MRSYGDFDFGKYSGNLYSGQTSKRALENMLLVDAWPFHLHTYTYNKYQCSVRFRGIPILPRNTTALSRAVLSRILLTPFKAWPKI